MADSMINDQVAMERILYVIEESLKVFDRSQFYGWAQGALQGVLPHDILLCVCGDLPSFRFSCKTFSTFAEDQKIAYRLTDPDEGVLSSIIAAWLSSGRKPLFYVTDAEGKETDPATAKLQRIGCGYVLAHGASEISNNAGSFFVFLKMPDAPRTRQGYLLELLMPHLHMALVRMLRGENESGPRDLPTRNVLSTRETEVLRWIGQGKTNQEIGGLLNISPLTVKNHVQKILRKLGVSNRAQAVFKANATRAQSNARVKIRGTQ